MLSHTPTETLGLGDSQERIQFGEAQHVVATHKKMLLDTLASYQELCSELKQMIESIRRGGERVEQETLDKLVGLEEENCIKICQELVERAARAKQVLNRQEKKIAELDQFLDRKISELNGKRRALAVRIRWITGLSLIVLTVAMLLTRYITLN